MQNPFLELDNRLRNIETMLYGLTHHLSSLAPVTHSDAGNELLTVLQTAQILDLKPATIYALVRQRLLPTHKRGRRLYFLKEDILAYIKGGRRKTVQELEQEAEEQLVTKQKGGR